MLSPHHTPRKYKIFPPNFLERKFSADGQSPQLFGRISRISAETTSLGRKGEVRNSRVMKSGYETELRKMTSHFELLTLFFFSPLMYNHTTSGQLYYKYLQNLQRLHARYTQSAKTTELNLRNTARKTLEKNAMLALPPKSNMFVC